jgi:WD40 repeat protein
MYSVRIILIIWLNSVFAVWCSGQNHIETVLQKGHARKISCVAYHPSGKYVATGSFDHTVKLWNTATGMEIRTFAQHQGVIRSISFSKDGQWLLSSSQDNKAIIYEIKTGKVIQQFGPTKERMFKAVFSPDGKHILTEDDRDQIMLWNIVSGELVRTLKKDYSAEITGQWFSSDGTKILSYGNYKTAYFIDLADSINSKTLTVDKAVNFAISPDNEYIAIGTAKKKALLYKLENGEQLYELDPNEEKICDGCKTLITFSPNSKYLATVSKYAGLVIWDARKGKMIRAFELDDNWLDDVAFSPDNKHVFVRADDKVWVWNIQTGTQALNLSFDGLECKPAFSPDGKYLLTTNARNTAALWNVTSGKTDKVFKGYLNQDPTNGMKFDEGNWYDSPIIRYLSYKPKITLSPTGKHLLKGDIDSVALLFNIETGKIDKIFQGHKKTVICSDFSNDGKRLITGSGDRTIKLWEVATGNLIRTFKWHQELVFDVKFSSDNETIVSGSWDAVLRMWNTSSGKVINYVNFENVSPYTLSFTPNDLYIASSDLGKELKLFEVDALKEFRNIVGHTNLVTDICFSPDQKKMITASLDGKVKVWDLLSGMLLNKFSGHSSGVFSVACHPDGKFIASGGNDRTIKIWDSETGKVLKTLKGHSGGVTSVMITSNGKTLISCSIDGEIKIWDLASYEEVYTYIQIDRENWLAKNPAGYFDGSPEALKLVNYVSGLEVITVGSLFEKFYSPNLIKRLMQGEVFSSDDSDLQQLIRNTPAIKLNILTDNTLNEINKTDSVSWFKNSIPISLDITDMGGGINEYRIYHNGKLIQNQTFDKSSKRAGKQYQETIEVPLQAGSNTITATAIDLQRTESPPVSKTIYFDGIESEINLYILSVGIDKYKNPAYELNYAINDARAYNKMIKKSAGTLFHSVEEYFIKDTDADKAGIEAAFNEIAQKAKPEDVFIFYYAGHGAMSMDNTNAQFFIIPYDVTKLYGDDEQLNQKAISSDELLEMSKLIAARKQMFVLDACQAGGALETFQTRGAHREKAIAQLARSTGTFFLLASGAIQYASEAKDLGHGIFTYALLEGLEGKADGGTMDEKITANELKSYVEDRVPELTNEYMLTPQYPTGYSFGQDFPVVIVK